MIYIVIMAYVYLMIYMFYVVHGHVQFLVMPFFLFFFIFFQQS